LHLAPAAEVKLKRLQSCEDGDGWHDLRPALCEHTVLQTEHAIRKKKELGPDLVNISWL